MLALVNNCPTLPSEGANTNRTIKQAKKSYSHKHLRKRKFKTRLKEDHKPQTRETIPIHESELTLCRLMWQSAILQALYDLANESDAAEAKLLRSEAGQWFFGDINGKADPDFEMVCELAAVSPAKTLHMARIVRKYGEKALEGFNSRTIRKKHSNRLPTTRKARREI